MGQILAMTYSWKTFAAGAAIILASCGNVQNDDGIIAQIRTGLAAKKQAAPPAPDIAALRAQFTPEVMAQIGGPILIVQIPSRDAVAVLTRVGTNNGVDTFLTPDGVSISLRDGMVVATRGLGFDLMTADIAEPLMAVKGSGDTAVRVHRYLDGENQIVAKSFGCAYSVTAVRQVTETCTSSSDNFENIFVMNANGNIASSRQWISPQIGAVLIERYE